MMRGFAYNGPLEPCGEKGFGMVLIEGRKRLEWWTCWKRGLRSR
jgi:hypothetical protein